MSRAKEKKLFETVTIKIRKVTRVSLKKLAAEMEKPMMDVVDELVKSGLKKKGRK